VSLRGFARKKHGSASLEASCREDEPYINRNNALPWERSRHPSHYPWLNGYYTTPSPSHDLHSANLSRSQLIALNKDFLSLDCTVDGKDIYCDGSTSLFTCISGLINNSGVLDVALQALSLLQLAIREHAPWLREESLVMNGKALTLMHQVLKIPHSAYSIETLAASICLKTYEVSLELALETVFCTSFLIYSRS
jgi:hypothetical protein